MHGASEQCMQATEIDRSPGLPSLIVTTRRRLTPQGTSCSFLHAVTQALHSMQRSASQRNFMRAMVQAPYALSMRHKVALVSCIRSEEHTSELQSLMRISYAVFCLKKKINLNRTTTSNNTTTNS